MKLFQSATFKLTVWYLAILVTLSLIFSVAIYAIAFTELNNRLENLQRGLTGNDFIVITPDHARTDQYRLNQSRQASEQLISSLFYVNLIVFVGGGIGSYLLARRTLDPIQRSHEAMSRFTSDASHELRTPLAAMKTELEVALRDDSLSTEDARELLESNLEEANKLIKLSETFLKLARLDYDEVEFDNVNLASVTKKVIASYDTETRSRLKATTKKSLMYGNETSLEELLVIFIDNALKYSTPDSPVEIKVREKRLHAEIQVRNQGEPIPPEQQARLFERFYRGDNSRTASDSRGYGLGLAIAKRIVDIHHGSIKVDSSRKKGTCFSISLPTSKTNNPKLKQSPKH